MSSFLNKVGILFLPKDRKYANPGPPTHMDPYWADAPIWKEFALEIAKSGSLERQNAALLARVAMLEAKNPWWRRLLGLAERAAPDVNAVLVNKLAEAQGEISSLKQKVSWYANTNSELQHKLGLLESKASDAPQASEAEQS